MKPCDNINAATRTVTCTPNNRPYSSSSNTRPGSSPECHALFKSMLGHCSPAFNRQLILQCQPIVEAIGCRMAYDTDRAQGAPLPSVLLFETNVVKTDLAWYVERGLVSRGRAREMEAEAQDAAYPLLEEWVENDKTGKYDNVPIISDEAWTAFYDNLPVYAGSAGAEVIDKMDVAAKAAHAKL